MASGLLILSAIAALALPVRALAQASGSASASAQYGSTSNLFASDTTNGQPAANGSRGAVSSFGYGTAFDGEYKWSRQSLYARASVNQSDYQGHLALNHYEFGIDAGLKWQLAEFLDGNLDVSRARAMVPFLDLTGSGSGESLSLQTAQSETMGIGLKLGSAWKLAGSGSTSSSTQSTAGASDQQLRQTSGTASLQYSGFGPLTSGLTATYASGDASGSDVSRNPPYHQTTAGLLANYKLKRTSFDGQVGYSRRSFSGAGFGSVSGVTGAIGFTDQLTEKTGFTINIARSINTQYLNLGSEVDTTAGVGVTWQATYKIGVALGYTFNYRDFPAQTQTQTQTQTGADTIDHQQSAVLTINYHPLRWLSIGTYANVQTRHSNGAGRDFNSTAYGVSLSATVGSEGTK